MINILNGLTDVFGLFLQSQDAANSGSDFCTAAMPILRIVGIVVFVIKVAVPIILIVVGMIELAKAVGEKDEKDIKAAQDRLVKRAIAAILVFLVITIVGILFKVLGQEQYRQCMTCVTSPFSGDCKSAVLE